MLSFSPEVPMTEQPPNQDPTPPMKVKKLRCRRTGQMFTVSEHAVCPYCYGDEKTIEKGGEYEAFCEFKPDEDPINFGFPPDSSRTQRG